MRVLQLVTRRQLRGAEVFAARLSEALVARGLELLFAGLYEPPCEPLSPTGVPVCDLGGRRAPGLSPRLVVRLARALRELQPAVIQANGSDTLKYAVAARFLAGERIPLVYRNISIASHWSGSGWKRHLYRRLFAAADRIVSVSEESRMDLVTTFGFPPERASVIYRGVPVPARVERDTARSRLLSAAGAAPGDFLLIHVGSLTAEKNHLGLLEAFRDVLDEMPGTHLCLAGTGPLEATLRQRAQDLGVSDKVAFLGPRADAPELAGGADLLLLFSDIEGVPGVALEAGAVETPTVASRVGGVPEAVIDGETGLLVPPRDMTALARAVIGLLGSQQRRRALGRGARARVLASFDLERAADQFLELYRELLGRSQP